ncbi:MAG: hypothetical protein NVSMB5_06560 [Candidatus Velthaea sp.]
MIFALLLAAHVAATAPPAPAAPVPLPPDAVLARYTIALRALREPRAISFEYRLEQTGGRRLAQTHRIFRTATDERDETLSVDGKRLVPPTVRIYRGKRNRYSVAALAPRVTAYAFAYVGPHRDGRHIDYVFRLTPKKPAPFAITEITIDGVRFLPQMVSFRTTMHGGSGSVRFGGNEHWWLPLAASARATLGAEVSAERLTFSAYRFPVSLPSSTFALPRPLATPKPALGA